MNYTESTTQRVLCIEDLINIPLDKNLKLNREGYGPVLSSEDVLKYFSFDDEYSSIESGIKSILDRNWKIYIWTSHRVRMISIQTEEIEGNFTSHIEVNSRGNSVCEALERGLKLFHEVINVQKHRTEPRRFKIARGIRWQTYNRLERYEWASLKETNRFQPKGNLDELVLCHYMIMKLSREADEYKLKFSDQCGAIKFSFDQIASINECA